MPDILLNIRGRNLSAQSLSKLQSDVKRTTKAFDDMRKGQKKLNEESKKTQEALKAVAVGSAVVAAALLLTVRSWIKSAVTLERLKKALLAVSGSAAKAGRQLKNLREIAKLPGLALNEAIDASIRLQVVGVKAEMAERSLRAFGNALASVGAGRKELGGVVLALSQMQTKGRVMGDDLRQLANWLPQIRKAMQDAFGAGTGADIVALGLTVGQFLEGVVAELEKLPRVASSGFNAIENFGVAFELLKANLGEMLLPTLIVVLETLSDVFDRITELSETQKGIVVWSTTITAGLVGIAAAATAFAVILPKMIIGLKGVAMAMTFLATNPIAWVVAGVAALAIGIGVLIQRSNRALITIDKFNRAIDETAQLFEKARKIDDLADTIDRLREIEDKTEIETKELINAQKELIALAPTMVRAIDDEGNAIAEATVKIRRHAETLRDIAAIQEAETLKTTRKEIARLTKAVAEGEKKMLGLTMGIEIPSIPGRRSFTASGTLLGTKSGRGVEQDETARVKVAAQLKLDIKELERLEGGMAGLMGPPEPPAKDVKTFKPTADQIKELTELAQREAMARAKAIEDEFDQRRRIAYDNTRIEMEGIQLRIRGLKKAEDEETKIAQEIEYERVILRRQRAVAEKELNQELKSISKDEEEAKRKEAKKTSEEMIKAEQKRISVAEAIQERIQELEAETFRSTIDAERSMIDMTDDRYDREMAQANLAFREGSNLLSKEMKLLDERSKDSRLTDKERSAALDTLKTKQGQLFALEKGWIDKTKKITSDRADDEVAKEESIQMQIFDSQKRRAESAAVIYGSAEAAKRADVIWSFKEQEELLKAALRNKELDVDVRKGLERELALLPAEKAKELDNLEVGFAAKRKTDAERKIREEEKAEKQRRNEVEKTYAAWYKNESLRIDLSKEGLGKELSYINLEYAATIRAIDLEMKAVETSVERKKQLEIQLGLLRGQMAADYKQATIDQYEIIGAISNRVAAVPFFPVRLLVDSFEKDKEMSKRLMEVDRERLDSIREVDREGTLSAAQRARDIEKIERDSAERRLQVEKDLMGKKGDLMEGYVKDFLMGILSEVEASLQKQLAGNIISSIASQLAGTPNAPAASGGGTNFGALVTSGIMLLSGNPIGFLGLPDALGFDSVSNDLLAKASGYKTALMSGSFDNSASDFRSQMSGTRTASYALGQRSVGDMLSNFEKGFMQSASRRTADSSGSGSGLSELKESLEAFVDNPPQFKLILDGRELHAVVQRLEDKRSARSGAF